MTNKNHTTDIKNNSNGIVDLHHRMYDCDDKKENPKNRFLYLSSKCISKV
ncbi:MAG: hypothetical protein KC589_06415 [Nanoarchaeota archaeon]|nr:hypothetical protein [Nanoarchaeota archaeon]